MMKIQKLTDADQDILDIGGGYVLTATHGPNREQDNAVINVLIEMMHTLARCGEVSDELANSFGCHPGNHTDARNFVYLPDDEFAFRGITEEAMA